MIEANDEMFFPYRDDNPPHSPPYLTYGIIGICVAVFLYQLGLSPEEERAFIMTYGFQPGAFFDGQDKAFSPVLSLFTSMFMHGGFMHLAGNMLYLWIFADNIECAMGRGRFVAFYLLTGIAAALSHAALDTSSMIPMVGASGAISGVLGAYLLIFPKANIKVFIMMLIITVVTVPAWIVLGGWFVMQFMGLAGGESNVAFWAHIGGFVAGMLLVKFFLKPAETLFHKRETPPWRAHKVTPVKGRGPLGRRRGPWG
jgi:membrane associated rhomboid family serine protease